MKDIFNIQEHHWIDNKTWIEWPIESGFEILFWRELHKPHPVAILAQISATMMYLCTCTWANREIGLRLGRHKKRRKQPQDVSWSPIGTAVGSRQFVLVECCSWRRFRRVIVPEQKRAPKLLPDLYSTSAYRVVVHVQRRQVQSLHKPEAPFWVFGLYFVAGFSCWSPVSGQSADRQCRVSKEPHPSARQQNNWQRLGVNK